MAQVPGLHSGLCLPVGDLKRPEEIPWQLDDRVHGGRLHPEEEERGGEGVAVANGMEEICAHGRRVREDLNHPDWDLSIEDQGPSAGVCGLTRAGAWKGSSSHLPRNHCPWFWRRIRLAPSGDTGTSTGTSATLLVKTPADKLGPPNGPLRVVPSSRKSGPGGKNGAIGAPHPNRCWSRSRTEAIQGNKVRRSWISGGGIGDTVEKCGGAGLTCA